MILRISFVHGVIMRVIFVEFTTSGKNAIQPTRKIVSQWCPMEVCGENDQIVLLRLCRGGADKACGMEQHVTSTTCGIPKALDLCKSDLAILRVGWRTILRGFSGF